MGMTSVQLVEYEAKHVELVHSWLANDLELRGLVSTEDPLSLEDEFEYQAALRSMMDRIKRLVQVTDEDGVLEIVGDVDVFFSISDQRPHAEINLMIADSKWRKRGIGSLALDQILELIPESYCKQDPFQSASTDSQIVVEARITATNKASVSFFLKNNFKLVDETPNVFGQVIATRIISNSIKD